MKQRFEIIKITICLPVIAFYFLLVFLPFAHAQKSIPEEVLIVATNYPPYEMENPEKGLKGFDVEVAEEAFNRAGIRTRIEFYPWARALEMSEEGKPVQHFPVQRFPAGMIIFCCQISSAL